MNKNIFFKNRYRVENTKVGWNNETRFSCYLLCRKKFDNQAVGKWNPYFNGATLAK